MMLVLDDESRVPFANVGRFGSADRDGVRQVFDTRGEFLGRCSEDMYQQAERASCRVIPAHPGWLCVSYSGPHDEEFAYDSEPVIGWLVNVDWAPLPIVASGDTVTIDSLRYFVLAPADSGASLLGHGWDEAAYRSLEEGLRRVEEQWREWRAERTSPKPVAGP
jgi:hypothetical protein